jgi:GTP-binding protein
VDKTLFFGGVSAEVEREPEETPSQRVASRINQVLAMRRAPRPVQQAVVETAWYDELGVPPTATQEELKLAYLGHAEVLEERLAYLLESPEVEERLDFSDELDEEEAFDDDDDEDRLLRAADSEEDADDLEEEVAGEDPEEALRSALLEDKEGQDALAISPGGPGPLVPAPERGEDDELTAAEQAAIIFTRQSNLYQILSVPQLRRIYDEGGIEGLAAKVPRLSKGLLDPEKVLLMAKGEKIPWHDPKKPESLLLRKEPRVMTYKRYTGANSIRQVLQRITDVFKVFTYHTSYHLAKREGTIFTELPEVCVLGRVNSGKSSMIQHLFAKAELFRQKFAARSQRPGSTEGINTYCFNKRFTISDMPGHSSRTMLDGRAGRAGMQWERYRPVVEEYLDTTKWLRAAIYVHDIGKDVTWEDRETVKMLQEHDIPTLLVFTKDDKVDSDTHRQSEVERHRRALRWPHEWPHAHYTTSRGGYGQVFKNMLGTMLLGLLATEERRDTWEVMLNELPEIFFDYRDKYVPRKKGEKGRKIVRRKVRTYDDEDKPITSEELREETEGMERRDRRRLMQAQKEAGYRRTWKDDADEEAGKLITPKERRKRWAGILEDVGL